MNEMNENTIPDDFRVADPYANRRQHLRSVFTYPIEFKIFTDNPVVLKGILRDISLGGSCIEFEDPYKRIILDDAVNTSVKLTLSIPGHDKVFILAEIRWITNIENTSTVKLGIEFSDLNHEQARIIEELMGMKNKDHNMMWNLWEAYQK